MKRNVKRSVITALIYCMGIGGLSMFVGALHPVSYADNLNGYKTESQERSDSLRNKDDLKENDSAPVSALVSNPVDIPTPIPTPTPSPAPSPIPTPLPVYELEEGGHPDIEKFFQDYYVAYNSCDYDLLKTLVTDPENMQPLADLKNETRFLDDIRNITCYIMKSYEEGSYIVYVYHELKYVNIKTRYPKLDKFYLVTDETGNFKIFSSEMDETLKAYYDDRDQDEKVQKVIEETDQKAQQVLNEDADLRIYLEALNN